MMFSVAQAVTGIFDGDLGRSGSVLDQARDGDHCSNSDVWVFLSVSISVFEDEKLEVATITDDEPRNSLPSFHTVVKSP